MTVSARELAFGDDLSGALQTKVHDAIVARQQDDPAIVPIAILAGGKGARLAPYTSVLPKPLMPVGDRAILEIVLGQLSACGFRKVTLCVGYLSHLIRAVLSNGACHGMDIAYVQESEPIGTAGPLKLIEGLDSTFVAMNGDILTTLDYRDLLRAHRESGNALTIATHTRTVKIDYGVLHLEDSSEKIANVSAYEEKPEFSMAVSMGIYVLEPVALDYVPSDAYFDFPELVRGLLRSGMPVGAYRFDGYWLDIGRHEDYAEATRVWESSEHEFLPA
jgi:NDP-sugar pyrophosphorylase family protein